MDRRKFLQTTSLVSAALAAPGSKAIAHEDANFRAAESDGTLAISNDSLAWGFEWKKETLRSSHFLNKLSGHHFALSSVQELTLVFSASKQRIEIPWWRFIFGPDRTPVPPPEERGLKDGYNLLNYSDREWGVTDNLLLRRLSGGGEHPDEIKYDGYGWFRHEFELPADAHGEEIAFVLGGYDFQDWNDYWIYFNGALLGRRVSSGRWRTPEEFVVAPGSANYASLRFGESNVLAVRTRGYDKHFGDLSEKALKRYVFHPVLADQLISVGKPYLRISDFKVCGVRREAEHAATFELHSVGHPIQAFAHYELDGATRRKWIEVINQSSLEMLLLDAQLDDFTLRTSVSEGGFGEPIFVGEEAFCGIEHPAGLNQGDNGRVRVMHFPAQRLSPGASVRSHVSLVSVAKGGQALDHFIAYIQERSPRKKKALAIYDPFGINNQWGSCPTQCDVEMLNGLQVLQEWAERGLHFDYYVPDWGWVDQSSDLTRFAPQCFPHGPGKVVERVKALGMNFGLWFSMSGANESCGEYLPAWPSGIPAPGATSNPGPPTITYKNGYSIDCGAPGAFCLASEPYFGILKNAIHYHMRTNSVRFIKLDNGEYYCNSTRHEHLPGKYSVEAMYQRLLDIAASARKLDPDVYVMWYWGVRSPFFALHGDTIFESGLFMEGSGTSWVPTLYYRDSVTLDLDQGTAFAKTIPPINKDSLGVWLADNRWGNFMGNRRWKEALIMDLGRGNLLFPQFWGDIYLLNEKDVNFLIEMTGLVKKNEPVFLRPRKSFGDTWKNEVYGYAYFQGPHGFIFANNVHFASRKVELELGPALGIEAQPDTPLSIVSHFPERRQLVGENGASFKAGERAQVALRPFEVLMLEVMPGETHVESITTRTASGPEFEDLGVQLPLQAVAPASPMPVQFADAERFLKERKVKKVSAFECTLPSLAGEQQILAIPVRLRQGNEEWRYSPVVVEIVQVVAWIGDKTIQLIPVPDARQYGDTQKAGCSWVLFKIRLAPEWSHKKLRFAVHAYLPKDVEPHIEAWVVKQWWQVETRPLGDGYYGNEPS